MRLLRVFFDTFMGYQHDGLYAIAKRQGIDLDDLREGECVVFVNRRFNRVKVYGPNNTFAYSRVYDGELDATAIQHIPNTFNGTRINLDQATRQAITERFERKNKQKKKA